MSFPTTQADRNVADYLFASDPSGQYMWGYAWSHCGGRPDDIYDVHGSGQCLTNGVPTGAFKLYGKEFVQTARVPTHRNPLRLTGAGYDIYGASFGLIPSSGHSVFKDNTPVIDFVNGDCTDYRSGPVDLRFHPQKNVWTAPYTAFIGTITAVAPNGSAYKPDLTLVSTLPVLFYYSVASGLYRYKATAYSVTLNEIINYTNFPLLNVAEFNNDLPYFAVNDHVMVIKNPSVVASGAYLCNERPISFGAFI